jgi:glutamine synthetase
MAQDVLKLIADNDVKFVCLQFTDVTGAVKSVDVPATRMQSVLKDGIWFDGSSVQGFARIQESDMHLVPDADTYAVLPWSQPERRRARIFCDIYTIENEPFPGDPRGVLKRILAKIEARGWQFNIGPEPEFFLVRKNGPENINPVPHDVGGYFDFSASDEAQRVRNELMIGLSSMGLEIEMGHHEVALGQHEIDFRFTDALQAADNVVTLKYTVKALAAQHGLVASFMPKPFFGINGSGMHTHQSIFDKDGRNLFFDPAGDKLLSGMAQGFIAGQLEHARAMAAVVAPTVNSYKRIVPGYEAPVYVCWAQMNRSAMIRIPKQSGDGEKSTRAELRFPDPTCNPYLAFTVMLAAGLDGIERELECPPAMNNVNLYELDEAELAEKGIRQLPASLGEAVDELRKDQVLIDALGEEAYDAFLRAKTEELESYRMHVTDWELERYLEIS